ncbi:MAG: hypothetical protein J5649_11255 [Lachnospiraceae bacterium]|nr:hypothetical protein [Lachnospiraceae bacterium]
MRNSLRKIAWLIVAALLVTAVLFGCSQDKPDERPGRPTEASTPSPSSVSSSVTPTDPPTPTNTPSPSPSPTPIRSRDDYTLSELYTPTYGDSVYSIPLGEYMEECYLASVTTNNDFVLISAFREYHQDVDQSDDPEEARLILFHLGVPDIVKVRSLSEQPMMSPVLFDDGYSIAYNGEGAFLVLDLDLQEVSRITVEGDSVSCVGAMDNHDMWILSRNDKEGDTLYLYSREGEQLAAYETNGVRIARYLCMDGSIPVFAAYRSDYTEYRVRLDTVDGVFRQMNGIHLELECYRDMLEYSTEQKWIFTDFHQSDPVYMIPKATSKEILESCENGRFSTVEWIFSDDSDDYETIYRVYDIKTQSLIGQLSNSLINDHDYFGQSHLTKHGYVLIETGIGADDTALLIWDPTSEPPVQVEGSQVVYPTSQIYDLRIMANRFLTEFGVYVYFEEVDMHGEMFGSYRLIPCEDMNRLQMTMNELYESVLEYPEGFWEDLLADGERGCVRFFLCGGFERTDLSAIEDAAALTSTSFEDICMAYGSTYINQFRETFVHESMHMMEVRIRHFCAENDLDFAGYWNNTLNTDKYPYFDAYTDDSGVSLDDTSGTYLDKPKKAWYIDAYSRTNEREDRARILEHLYLGNNFYFKESSHLRDKAEHVCAIIRAAFPSIRNSSSEMRWESYIGILDPAPYLRKYRSQKQDQDQEIINASVVSD